MKLVLAGRHFRRRLPYPPGYTNEQLRAVSVPVQVLLGQRSALHESRAVAARLAEAVPGWRVEIVPGTGHALPLEASELVVDRFLRLTSQGQSTTTEPPTASRP